MLKKKYGPPKEEHEPEDWHKPVHHTNLSKWETDTTQINCWVKNFGKSEMETAEFCVAYESKELQQLGIESTGAAIRQLIERMKKTTKEYESSLPLEVLDWRWYQDDNWFRAVGQVKNKTQRTLRYVTAVVIWYDKYQKMVTYATSSIEYSNLTPGKTSPFSVDCRYMPNVATARLEFKDLSGNELPAAFGGVE